MHVPYCNMFVLFKLEVFNDEVRSKIGLDPIVKTKKAFLQQLPSEFETFVYLPEW